MNKKSYIGVFDSGIGGLNVLSNLIETFPNENFLYIGDNLNVPYGIKSQKQLEEIIKDIFNYFEKEDVKAIVVACNTASAASENMTSLVPVFRIIEPTAINALKISNRIGVLATNFTIESKGYDKYLKDNMIGIKASPFVTIVENNTMNEKDSLDIINKTLSKHKDNIDTIILGCTHFSLLEKQIKDVLGNINIVDSSRSFNDILDKYLKENDLYNDSNTDGDVKICFTKEDKINISWFDKKYNGINFINVK